MSPPGPRLSAEERALWARVASTVTPLQGREADVPASTTPQPFAPSESCPEQGRRVEGVRRAKSRLSTPQAKASPPPPPRKETHPPTDTLDGGWDRRIRRGAVSPDRTIDLHGHNLLSAQSALEHAIARSIADDVRVLLVITGKPPKAEVKGRGLIRAAIGDWLGTSGYRDRIAAVRHAHPRHGGTGALYLILRRKRGE